MSDVNTTSDGAAAPAWRERKNLLLGGAIGAAVLLLAGYFLVFSGGSSDEEFGAIPSAANRIGAGAASPSASASPTGASTVPAVYDEDIYGDPFKPMYPAAPDPATSTAAAAAAAPAGGGAPAAPQSQPSEYRPPATAKASTSLRLIRVVDEDTVVVAVDGSKYESVYNIGTAFGVFVLVSTRPDESEATFNYGDGTPFTMSEGETQKFAAA